MNKKILLLITASIIMILIIASTIYYFFTLSNVSNSGTTDSTSSKQTINVEEGLGSISKPIKSAVEAYTTQDRSESTSKRNERLRKYFSSDSPVYNYEPSNIGYDIKESSAIVTSIATNNSEGIYPSVDVITQTTLLLNNNSSTTADQTYWVIFKRISDKSISIYDIGEY